MANTYSESDYHVSLGSITIDGLQLRALTAVTDEQPSTDYEQIKHTGLTDFVVQKVPTWTTPGNYSISAKWNATDYASLVTKWQDRDVKDFTRTLPDGTQITGKCYVGKPYPETAIDGTMNMTVPLEVTGGPQQSP